MQYEIPDIAEKDSWGSEAHLGPNTFHPFSFLGSSVRFEIFQFFNFEFWIPGSSHVSEVLSLNFFSLWLCLCKLVCDSWLGKSRSMVLVIKAVNVERVMDLIKFRSWKWLKCKNKNFIYSSWDWSSNPHICLGVGDVWSQCLADCWPWCWSSLVMCGRLLSSGFSVSALLLLFPVKIMCKGGSESNSLTIHVKLTGVSPFTLILHSLLLLCHVVAPCEIEISIEPTCWDGLWV